MKEKALKGYLTELSQYLSCPVKVAQLLFSERCINKIALEKMETLEDSLDEKKTTLLSAIHAIVSSNHCTERQQEIETLQKIVTLLMLKLDERDKQIEEMKRSWKGRVVGYYCHFSLYIVIRSSLLIQSPRTSLVWSRTWSGNFNRLAKSLYSLLVKAKVKDVN